MIEMSDLQSQCEQLLVEKAELITFKQHSNYKCDHYDAVKRLEVREREEGKEGGGREGERRILCYNNNVL